MTNLESILKSRDIILSTKVRLVKAMVFLVVMYRCESWTIKKAESQRTDDLNCGIGLLRVPWTARRSNQSILKEIIPGCSLEGLMLKLKLQYFVHLMRRAISFEKTLMLGEIEGRRTRGWHRMRWLDGINDSMDISSVQSLSSVQFIWSVVSDSLWPDESRHARPPCPSPTHRVHSDSCPMSQWCHPAISSWVVPFSSCPKSLPASESFPMSQLFAWGGQSTGVSALASFSPKKSQGWSPSEWTGWISLQFKGLSRVFSNTTAQNHQFFSAQLSS